jgi:transcription antitermination factor NusG
LEDFLPQYLAIRRWSDRIKRLEAPLFPRYVFCRFDLRNKLSVLTTPGVVSVLGIGNPPLPVPEAEITALRAIVQSHLPVQPWPFLKIGQCVQLECGPLAGLEGILLEFKNLHRLVVSVTLLQRSVAVEIERWWAVPMSEARRPFHPNGSGGLREPISSRGLEQNQPAAGA